MTATSVSLLVKSLQSCCEDADTRQFLTDLATIANDIITTVSAIWPAANSLTSAPAESQMLQIAVDVNDFIDTLDKMTDVRRRPMPEPVVSTATTVLGAILVLLKPLVAAHNLALAPGASAPLPRPAMPTLAMPLRSHSIRAAAERHAAALSPDAARSELAAVQFPGG